MYENKVNDLVERLKYDASDFKGENPHSWGLNNYLKTILKNDGLLHIAAIGSLKQAIGKGVLTLSNKQFTALAIDIINNELYMAECPNNFCKEKIAWGDMDIAIYEGKCYHCRLRQENIERA